MRTFRTSALGAAISAALLAGCAMQPGSNDRQDDTMSDTSTVSADAFAANPFATESTLPYHAPRFDLIRDEHFTPAFEEGMRRGQAEYEKILANPEPATFENTIVAMENAGELLSRTSSVFSNLVSADTNPTREKIQSDMAPKRSAYRDSINLDPRNFNRIDSLFQKRASLGLDAESLRLLERYHEDLILAGAQLDEPAKVRLKTINARLAELSTDFSQNVLAETNDGAIVVEDGAELEGLSDAEIAAAAEAAQARDMAGKWVLPLQNTTQQPALERLKSRALRERIYQQSANRGIAGNAHDNRDIIRETAKLRAERAQLLGYPDHASWSLARTTARDKKAVNDLLGKLAPAAVANARAEAADLQALIDREKGGFKLAAWDWPYYTEKLRAERYDFDATKLKPYFEMKNVLENGVFYMAKQVYGLDFKRRTDLPVYHPDVMVYEAFEADGRPLGLFYADMFARESKRGGAWMNSYVDQSAITGDLPVVANHLNIPKPPEGQPALLTFDEVTTMFHEFGHALHGLFSNVQYPYFSGTSVPRDFVEYPSQVHEMWATWPQVLANYAKHYQTGEPIPRDLLDRVIAADKFNQGYATTEYLAASLLDQGWHQLSPDQVPTDVVAFENATLKRYGVDLATVPPRYRSAYFSHIFSGGYSAGYYSYIWSEVMDADTVAWFKEGGGMKRELGDRFRASLLSRGGSVDAMQLFRDLRGRDPVIEPLLERRGLEAGMLP